MTPELIKKFAAPVPRYTSYPTAPHFTPTVDAATYGTWLGALDSAAPVSVYLHVPFCDTLCWYCGCSTKMIARYDPVREYVGVVLAEIALLRKHLPARLIARHVHWGGGSPNTLEAGDIRRVGGALREAFELARDGEFAVEIDPRQLASSQVKALAEIGVNRISLGVQDFDPRVQAAINRDQSYDTTRRAVRIFREHGIGSVNIDLVYGLPYQTADSVRETMRQVLELGPDRIALFGYAHLPTRFAHQRLIPDEALPGPQERYVQSSTLADMLIEAGYARIGLDHFARRSDSLAQKEIHRNFQGYTTDGAETLIGIGASAIGKLPQGYIQNAVATGDHARRIRAGALATARGIALSTDDRVRGLAIERLMCDLKFPGHELERRFGPAAQPVLEEATALVEADDDGLVAAADGGFIVTERGRPFIRTICSRFDTYLGAGQARHSAGV
jgi:oxygen-independent coproporphyrinogen-3 oxidase